MALLPQTTSLNPEFPYIPEDLEKMNNVHDVLKVDFGREYWKVVGDGYYMNFDLSSSYTKSIITLDSFLERVGK